METKKQKKALANESRLANLTENLLAVERTFQNEPKLWIALDFETWEMDHDYVTEIGISTVYTKNGGRPSKIETQHIRIEDYAHLRNGRYVPDNSYNFRHGVTKLLPLKAALSQLRAALRAEHTSNMGLIMHDAGADLEILQGLGLERPRMLIVDTRDLWAARTRAGPGQYTRLSKVLETLGISAPCLHNAGNDSHATMEAFLAMMKDGRYLS